MTIKYSAGAKGVVGSSWSLDLGGVVRTGLRGGAPTYTDSDDLFLSIAGSGTRLIRTGDHYETEDQSFARIEHVIDGGRDYWRKQASDGTVYLFGYGFEGVGDSQTRGETSSGARIWRWHLDRIVDRHGNYLLITYRRIDGSDNQIFPDEIVYSGKVEGPGVHPGLITRAGIPAGKARRIRFEYEPLQPSGAADRALVAGFPVVTTHRLRDVRVFMTGSLLRRYHLSYRTTTSALNLLERVELFGRDDASTLPATVYTYASPPAGFEAPSGSYAVRAGDEMEHVYGRLDNGRPHATDPLRIHDQGTRYVDLDGDGLTDYLRSFSAACDYPGDSKGAFRNLGNGTFSEMPGFVPPVFFSFYSDLAGTEASAKFVRRLHGNALVQLRPYAKPEVPAAQALESNDVKHYLELRAAPAADGRPAAGGSFVADLYANSLGENQVENTAIRAIVDESLRAAQAPAAQLREVPTNRYTSYLVTLLPGVIGMTLLVIGLNGFGAVLIEEKHHGLHKNLKTIDASPLAFLAGLFVSRLLVAYSVAVALFVVGVLVFGIPVDVNYALLLLVVTLGCLAFLGIGLVLATLSPSVEAFNGIVSFVQIPFIVLGGVFFSANAFPDWLQFFTRLMPLTQLNTAMRELLFGSVGFHNITKLYAEIAVLGGWCVFALVFARLRFKW